MILWMVVIHISLKKPIKWVPATRLPWITSFCSEPYFCFIFCLGYDVWVLLTEVQIKLTQESILLALGAYTSCVCRFVVCAFINSKVLICRLLFCNLNQSPHS